MQLVSIDLGISPESENHAVGIIRELSAFGVEPFVFCHRHGPLESHLNGQGIRCSAVDLPYLEDGVGGFQALARICSIVPRLSSFLKSENATRLHANDSRMTHTWMPAAEFQREVQHDRPIPSPL